MWCVRGSKTGSFSCWDGSLLRDVAMEDRGGEGEVGVREAATGRGRVERMRGRKEVIVKGFGGIFWFGRTDRVFGKEAPAGWRGGCMGCRVGVWEYNERSVGCIIIFVARGSVFDFMLGFVL